MASTISKTEKSIKTKSPETLRKTIRDVGKPKGEGRTVTLEMLEAAVQMILDGAKLIATNLDPNCPTKNGETRPGCGATVAYLETATGAEAFSLGKPSPIMMRAARKELGLSTSQTVMIGDTMGTDILGGVQMGYRTVLVLSGGTKLDDVRKYAFTPDCIVKSVAELCARGSITLSSLPAPNTEDDSVDLNDWSRMDLSPQHVGQMK